MEVSLHGYENEYELSDEEHDTSIFDNDKIWRHHTNTWRHFIPVTSYISFYSNERWAICERYFNTQFMLRWRTAVNTFETRDPEVNNDTAVNVT